MKVKIKLSDKATLPSKSHASDAGFDLTATSMTFKSGFIEYGTGVHLELPEGYVGLIYPRSSISKYDVTLANSVGVIDQGYNGEIKLRFRVDGPRPYRVNDRIGQLVIMPIPAVEFEQVEELGDTDRSEGGFGSSGE